MATVTEPTTTPEVEPARRPRPGRAPQLQPSGPIYQLKRAILGPAIPTQHLIHERLGKVTALSIFSSDALSSVAYATEEMLRVFVAAGVGAAMFALIMPVSIVIVLVLVTLIFSYRQTIKAYPSAGGAYIVTKDNFGLLPAQVAGVALLTDYVLTVAVSISAGVAAIVSVVTGLYPYRVPLALVFLALLIWGNLRGVRESGRMFAAPTYVFIGSVFTLLIVSAVRLSTGSLQPLPHGAVAAVPANAGLLMGVSMFIVLKALASGSTAMTGVEAISNGVPAFKPPEWRNARATLVVMGSILGTMFLGISYLAHRLQVVPDPTERRTVLSLIADAAFGRGVLGHTMFVFLQVATMAILVLAANTSFADFPRLANFHAGDSFMPRQFTRRGHRLVFSNGIIALGVAAGVLIVLFQANVTRLIPFYAIGVFTSFTMSQAGMAKRHLRLREPGWRTGFLVNGLGAIATGVVDIVIAVTKFPDDLAIIILVPILVVLLVRMNHQYERETRDLDEGLSRFRRGTTQRPTAVVLVDELDRKTLHAIQYAKTIRPREIHAVHVDGDRERTAALRERWRDVGIPLRVIAPDHDAASCISRYATDLLADGEVTVIVPGPARMGFVERVRAGRTGAHIAKALAPFENARVTLVRDHVGAGHTLLDDRDGDGHVRLTPRPSHEVIVLVDRADRATMRAVRYALSLGAEEVRAVHAAVDPDGVEPLIDRWMELGVPIDLDLVECWDRNVARALEREVVARLRPDREVTVVLPRRDYATLRQRILHDRTSRKIATALGRYEHVDIAVVPFHFSKRRAELLPAPTPLDTAQ